MYSFKRFFIIFLFLCLCFHYRTCFEIEQESEQEKEKGSNQGGYWKNSYSPVFLWSDQKPTNENTFKYMWYLDTKQSKIIQDIQSIESDYSFTVVYVLPKLRSDKFTRLTGECGGNDLISYIRRTKLRSDFSKIFLHTASQLENHENEILKYFNHTLYHKNPEFVLDISRIQNHQYQYLLNSKTVDTTNSNIKEFLSLALKQQNKKLIIVEFNQMPEESVDELFCELLLDLEQFESFFSRYATQRKKKAQKTKSKENYSFNYLSILLTKGVEPLSDEIFVEFDTKKIFSLSVLEQSTEIFKLTHTNQLLTTDPSNFLDSIKYQLSKQNPNWDSLLLFFLAIASFFIFGFWLVLKGSLKPKIRKTNEKNLDQKSLNKEKNDEQLNTLKKIK
ncbi:hypothetical protein M0812_10518 [Anaeramoeba flamelloides]|uniref:Transmembrane protein n=1 Tax=Anaeramoeba flamelloides TaxID=1746091 RepID=A0AAV7ZW49_9EUKA|nr:hypothetical protein M0812_10518 [Anaeramoeba flamelloides]